jgi:hypothetical protein
MSCLQIVRSQRLPEHLRKPHAFNLVVSFADGEVLVTLGNDCLPLRALVGHVRLFYSYFHDASFAMLILPPDLPSFNSQ